MTNSLRSRKVNEVFKTKLVNGAKYGIEIEAEFVLIPDFIGNKQPNFKTTVDGSLMGAGYEFITETPTGKLSLFEEVSKLYEQKGFQDNYRNSSRTSTHIHANVSDKDMNQLFTILTGYYLLEPFIIEYAGRPRVSNLFCLGLWEAEHGMNALKHLWSGSRDLVRNFDEYKYSALNIANVGKLGTIEFRMFSGTNNKHQVKGYLDVVDLVMKIDKLYNNPDQVFNDFVHNRHGFVSRISPVLLPICEKHPEYFDLNYSNVFNIINLEAWELKSKLSNRARPEYRFSPELDYDNHDNFVEIV